MSRTHRIAVIPARGGSKRLPRKNIIDFFGRPILAYTVAAARESAQFDRVVVSTEDAEIADVARSFGADVHDRPPFLATDDSTIEDVCLHLLAEEAKGGHEYDALACLYATAPLRNADDIRAIVGLLNPPKCEFAMAVAEYNLPPLLALRTTEDGSLEPMWPEMIYGGMRRYRNLVVSEGSTYAVTVTAFRRYRTFYGPGLRGYVMPPARSTDIDMPWDLEVARWKGRRLGLGR